MKTYRLVYIGISLSWDVKILRHERNCFEPERARVLVTDQRCCGVGDHSRIHYMKEKTDKEFLALVESLIHFFESQSSVLEPPIALAFSGGADSTFLLHILVHLFQRMKKNPQEILAIYIDHGWRPESAQEAVHLKAVANSLGVSYLSLQIPPEKVSLQSSNLEEKFRIERYRLLYEECAKRGISSLFLGHHADDQVEVIFKRLLEGSSLQALKAMGAIEDFPLPLLGDNSGASSAGMIRLIRPLLTTHKSSIVEWLNQHSISYVHDSTNEDETYLRNRLRLSLFPFLKEQFGKEIEGPLLRISDEARRFHEYILSAASSRIRQMKGKRVFYLELVNSPLKNEDGFLVEQLLFILKREYPLLSLFSRKQIVEASEVFAADGSHSSVKWFFAGHGPALICQPGRILFLSSYRKTSSRDPLSIEMENTCLRKQVIWNDEWEITWDDFPICQEKLTQPNHPIWFSLLDGEKVSFRALVDKSSKSTLRVLRVTDKLIRSYNLSRKDKARLTLNSSQRFTLLRELIPGVMIDNTFVIALSESPDILPYCSEARFSCKIGDTRMNQPHEITITMRRLYF